MQHAWKHVERPGRSYTALDGKKSLPLLTKASLLHSQLPKVKGPSDSTVAPQFTRRVWQPWVLHVNRLRLLELHGRTCAGVFMAAGATDCAV